MNRRTRWWTILKLMYWRWRSPPGKMILDNLGLTIDLSEPRTAEESFQLLNLTFKDFGMAIAQEMEPILDRIKEILEQYKENDE